MYKCNKQTAFNYFDLKEFLDEKVDKYNTTEFIPNDPISIPHRFTKKQDIEIMGFFAAILAWGQRKTTINKCAELIKFMDGTPYDFIIGHKDSDLKAFLNFKHRTFNATDILYFIAFLRDHYSNNESLEDAFLWNMEEEEWNVEKALINFHHLFFGLDNYPHRTKKHISTPIKGSSCKRLNMFLRWMVRKDDKGVDFGIWKKIKQSQLVCPCDVHVNKTARKLGLITCKQTNWLSALELTENLKQFDPEDPVKYDFALFGLGVLGIRDRNFKVRNSFLINLRSYVLF